MNLSKVSVCSLSVMKTKTDIKIFEVPPRKYHSLSYRIAGKNIIRFGDKMILSDACSLTFVPADLHYVHEIVAPSEQIVIHFTTGEGIGDEAESILPPSHFNMSLLFAMAYECWRQSPEENNLKCMSIFYEMLALIKRNLQEGKKQYEWLDKSVESIHANYQKSDFKISTLYKEAFVSPAYYRRIFQKEYGCTPVHYVKKLRINYACCLLESGYYTVAETSQLCGFSAPAYFSYEFKRFTGLAPSEYLTSLL